MLKRAAWLLWRLLLIGVVGHFSVGSKLLDGYKPRDQIKVIIEYVYL